MQMTESQPPRKSPRRPPRWVFEATLVIASVVLGYGAAQFADYRADRILTRRMLASLQAELAHNLATLEPMVPMHRQWVAALNSADLSKRSQSALDVYFAVRPQLPANASSPFPLLRRSAWDAAVAGGALRLLDYDVIIGLSDVYRMQEIATDNVNRLAAGALSSTSTYDPVSRVPATRLLWLTLADISAAEASLLELYRKHLPEIQRAAAISGSK